MSMTRAAQMKLRKDDRASKVNLDFVTPPIAVIVNKQSFFIYCRPALLSETKLYIQAPLVQ